jgi:hypothetical protein
MRIRGGAGSSFDKCVSAACSPANFARSNAGFGCEPASFTSPPSSRAINCRKRPWAVGTFSSCCQRARCVLPYSHIALSVRMAVGLSTLCKKHLKRRSFEVQFTAHSGSSMSTFSSSEKNVAKVRSEKSSTYPGLPGGWNDCNQRFGGLTYHDPPAARTGGLSFVDFFIPEHVGTCRSGASSRTGCKIHVSG